MMSRNFTPEQTLIDNLIFDDTAALEELSRRYSYSLYSYCMHKLNSAEDAKRIVRNIFIALWEDRYVLPVNFSLSLYLYMEVRKAVVQCVNSRLNANKDIPALEKQIIPYFSDKKSEKARQPINEIVSKEFADQSPAVKKRSFEEQRGTKFWHIGKGLKQVFQNILNLG